jgi:hypothetical protein
MNRNKLLEYLILYIFKAHHRIWYASSKLDLLIGRKGIFFNNHVCLVTIKFLIENFSP